METETIAGGYGSVKISLHLQLAYFCLFISKPVNLNVGSDLAESSKAMRS